MGSARIERVARWWEGHYYPDAGEVVGWRETRLIRHGEEASYPPAMMGTRVAAGSALAPPGPGEDTTARASRRARTKLRRYAVSNRLRFMWVLTFAPDACEVYPCAHLTDLTRVKRLVSSWVKRGLRGTVGYEGAYVLGWERHKSGAWHVNVIVGEFLSIEAVGPSWGRGNVWVSKFQPKPGESSRDTSRRAAAYVAKYVSKEFGAQAGAAGRSGAHRYEVAQGFAVRVVHVFALSAGGIVDECGAGLASYEFHAPSAAAGRGPPIVWAAFA